MLSPANEEIVRAALPVVQQQLETITGVFYDTMLTERPERTAGMVIHKV